MLYFTAKSSEKALTKTNVFASLISQVNSLKENEMVP